MDEAHLFSKRDYPELRDAVRRLCADFPATYWRTLDEERGYPTDFVRALSQAGFLAAGIGSLQHGPYLARFMQNAT